MEENCFRSFFSRLEFGWQLGLVLILLWGIPRFLIVMGANMSGNYQYVSIIFLTMIILPFLLLNSLGRKKIGLTKPIIIAIIIALISGIIFCMVMYLTASRLFEGTTKNWFVYISRSFSNLPKDLSYSDRTIFFIIYAVISMTFSPIGEEFFYRGLVHECFSKSWGNRWASIADSSAFSLTHLAHFGIVYIDVTWQLYFIPALLWVLFLFTLSLLFYWFRKKSSSIWGAVIAHAGYNLAMTYMIFYYVL
jgi:membrane protease YdiL (CAAX protease family)